MLEISWKWQDLLLKMILIVYLQKLFLHFYRTLIYILIFSLTSFSNVFDLTFQFYQFRGRG